MLPTEIKLGWIFRYSYLWDWQHREGREEGDKEIGRASCRERV